MIRLYFNEHGERPWSIDMGDPASELDSTAEGAPCAIISGASKWKA
jgi:hypothetical protein